MFWGVKFCKQGKSSENPPVSGGALISLHHHASSLLHLTLLSSPHFPSLLPAVAIRVSLQCCVMGGGGGVSRGGYEKMSPPLPSVAFTQNIKCKHTGSVTAQTKLCVSPTPRLHNLPSKPSLWPYWTMLWDTEEGGPPQGPKPALQLLRRGITSLDANLKCLFDLSLLCMQTQSLHASAFQYCWPEDSCRLHLPQVIFRSCKVDWQLRAICTLPPAGKERQKKKISGANTQPWNDKVTSPEQLRQAPSSESFWDGRKPGVDRVAFKIISAFFLYGKSNI